MPEYKTNVQLTEEQQNMVDSIMRTLFPVFQAHYDATVGMDTTGNWWQNEVQGLKRAVRLELEIWISNNAKK